MAPRSIGVKLFKQLVFRNGRMLIIVSSIAGLIYLFSQLMSFTKLNEEYLPISKSKVNVNSKSNIQVSLYSIETPNNFKSDMTVKLPELPSEFHLTGVNPEFLYRYNPKSKINCPSSHKLLKFSQINDDYCDCEISGFDEPGTNACLHSRFYCQTGRNSYGDISSYRVNDGICDCCDGTDEWLDNKLPSYVSLSIAAQQKSGTFQTPCTNRC